MPKRVDPAPDKGQIQKFRDTARDLGCDESEERFNAALKQVARHKPVSDTKPKPKKKRA
jgi:hypothetical protein